jgi:hypothetical protein
MTSTVSLSSTEPSVDYAAVTPSDGTDLPDGVCRGLYIGSGGNLVVISQSGSTVTFTGVVTGSVLPIRAKRVKSTSTTASSIVALY